MTSYYTVLVRSAKYHGKQALTYNYNKKLAIGSIVEAELQKELVLGVVNSETPKPAFKTKSINQNLQLPPLPPQILKLANWLAAYYPASLGIVAQQILPTNLPDKRLNNLEPLKASLPKINILPTLTEEQTAAYSLMQAADTYLLHGKTGSGKTRLYIELTLDAINNNKSALILTPEIGLTSQLADNFRQVFGEQVIVLHSQLTPKERQTVWLTILSSSVPVIVVGPRSALFSPIRDLGLVVVDEIHEPAYKQDQAPHYHASRVAAVLANLHSAKLVLGSATPPITDYFLAQQKNKTIIRLNQLARQSTVAKVNYTVVDLKDRSLFTRAPHLSTPLIKAIQAALSRGEQTLLYLNRRGTARTILCENCGWQAVCPHCDLPLTYHGDRHKLQCHTCGFQQPSILSCPVCGHPSILFKGIGTKALADEVSQVFPEAKIQRFDTDNIKSERFEQQYQAVKDGKVDILVGTQLLAKGHDLPHLSTLGIITADSSLTIPDFSSQERTYQLLTQVLGRVGRGHREGHAIIQTYHPEQPIIQAALSDDWENFYATELAEREQYKFPPFRHLLKLTCRRASIAAAQKAAIDFKALITTKVPHIEVDGPAPSFHEKFQNKYQWQLVVKSTNRLSLIQVIDLLPSSSWQYDIDPVNLL
jgi:primosomal protein N' (replication factor Y)